MTLDVLRKGTTLQLTATPDKLDTLWKFGFAGVPVPIRDEPLSLLPAFEQIRRLLQEQCTAGGRSAAAAVYASAFGFAADGTGGHCAAPRAKRQR